MRLAVGEKWSLMSVCISWLAVGIDKAWSGSGIALYSPRFTTVSLISISRTILERNSEIIIVSSLINPWMTMR